MDMRRGSQASALALRRLRAGIAATIRGGKLRLAGLSPVKALGKATRLAALGVVVLVGGAVGGVVATSGHATQVLPRLVQRAATDSSTTTTKAPATTTSAPASTTTSTATATPSTTTTAPPPTTTTTTAPTTTAPPLTYATPTAAAAAATHSAQAAAASAAAAATSAAQAQASASPTTTTTVPLVTVPNVVGMTLAAGEAALQSAGLTYAVGATPGCTAGKIHDTQTPTASPVPIGTRVFVIVTTPRGMLGACPGTPTPFAASQ